jgi:hypothetical protein
MDCGCDCISCGLPLTAVNAAKTQFRTRPHFRHPPGAEKDKCLVLAARAVLLDALRDCGLIDLPRRRLSRKVLGLSGEYYEATVESPSERVSIKDYHFQDEAKALLTLEDGRQLQVVLTGTHETALSADALTVTPIIILTIDDPHIAAMSPAEIRSRLTLMLSHEAWCRHWQDPALANEAEVAARARAAAALDWLDPDAQGAEVGSKSAARESLLHLKAKEILARERRIRFPDLPLEAKTRAQDRSVLRRQAVVPSDMVHLESVILEKHLGRVRPDVVATTAPSEHWPAGHLLVEITVTNSIADARLAKIREMGMPAIEIDISRMGGRVTEDEFARLVVEEQAGKRWLYHPLKALKEAQLQEELAVEVRAAAVQQETKRLAYARRRELEARPIRSLAEDYLNAIWAHAEARALQKEGPSVRPSEAEAASKRVQDCSEGLVARGYLLAGDDVLAGAGAVLERLLVLKPGRVIGDQNPALWHVIKTMMADQAAEARWHALYQLALDTYRTALEPHQQAVCLEWKKQVTESLKRGETLYLWDRRHDKLIVQLFPELRKIMVRPLNDADIEAAAFSAATLGPGVAT